MRDGSSLQEIQQWNAIWDEFEAADYAGRVALFHRAVESGAMDAEMAFEMLNELYEETLQTANRAAFDGMILALRQKAPAVFAEDAPFYFDWLVVDALADGRYAAARAYALDLVPYAADLIAAVAKTITALAYHNQLETLNAFMAEAWPVVKESDAVYAWAMDEFGLQATNYAIFDYLETTDAPRVDDPILRQALEPYLSIEEDGLVDYLANLMDAPRETAVRADFAFTPLKRLKKEERIPHEIWHNLSELSSQFLGYLRHQEQTPYAKGRLANATIVQQLHQQLISKVTISKSTVNQPPAEILTRLVLERDALNALFNGLLNGETLNLYKATAVFELLPAWLRFLTARQLITTEERQQAAQDLTGLKDRFETLWEAYPLDPALIKATAVWKI